MKYSNEILHNLLYFMNNKTDAVFSFLILYIFKFSLMSAMVYVDRHTDQGIHSTVGLKDTQGKKKLEHFGLGILLEGQKWHQKTIKPDPNE